MKNKAFLLMPALLLLVGCNTNKGGNTSNNNSNHSDVSNTDTSSNSESSQGVTLIFKGSSTREGMTPGSQLRDNTSEYKPDVAFKSVLGSYVSSYTSTSCSFAWVGPEDETTTSLTIGSSSYGGELVLNLTQKVTSIKVTLQGYYKLNKDSNADIYINDQHFDMSSTGETPDIHEEEIDFETPVEQLKFSNEYSKHRTYVHELTLFY